MTERREAALPGGAIVRLSLPQGAKEEPAEVLPRVDVSALSGARVGLRIGFADEPGPRLRVVCVEAPADRFAPGLEEVVLGMATHRAHVATSESVVIERWEPGAITRHEGRFEQVITGQGAREGRPLDIRARLVLGFEGDAPEALLCTFVCDEPKAGGVCDDLVAEVELASLVPPPPPSMLIRAILFAAEEPRHAAMGLVMMGTMMVAVLLARRPRPRP